METRKPGLDKKERSPQLTETEEIKYRGKMFEIVTDHLEIDGQKLEFEKVRRSPGARLILRDFQGNILLTKEYRREVGRYDYRLPGGKVFDSLDEFDAFRNITGSDIKEEARRAALKEAKEETGYEPVSLVYDSSSQLGASVEWDLHYFSGVVDRAKGGVQALETGEDISVEWFSETQARALILDHMRFSEDRSALALLRHLLRTETSSEKTATGEGSRLARALKVVDLKSVRLRERNIEKLQHISNVVFVGSSLVGKTTLIDALRAAFETDTFLDEKFVIPKRVITRPERVNDDLVENKFVTAKEFEDMVSRGDIGLHWVRKMEGDRRERYGFLKVDDGKLPIYSANNAIVNNRDSVVPGDLLQGALIVAVYSPDEIRAERMRERSPDLLAHKSEEAKYRLADRAISMYPDAHVVIKNFDHYAMITKMEIVTLIRQLALLKHK